MKLAHLLIMLLLLAVPNGYASSDIVVKIGSDTKDFKAKLIKLEKYLKVITIELNKLDYSLAIPSHAAGEVHKLERALKRATELSMVTELHPGLKGKGEEFRERIKNIESSIQKAREVSEEVAIKVVAFHKEVNQTKLMTNKLYQKVGMMIKKDIPRFNSGMTGVQDCVYKADQNKRKCMQEELNSASEDLESLIEDSSKEVTRLTKVVEKLKGQVDHIQRVIKKIHSTISPLQKVEFYTQKQFAPLLKLHELMNKDYEERFLIRNPYKPKKMGWFYVKVTGKDIIIGVLHTMEKVERKLKGRLQEEANKASVKKLAKSLNAKLNKDLKKALRKLNLGIKFDIPGIETLHTTDSSLMEPLEELSDTIKEIKLEMAAPKAVMCKKLTEECR